MSQWRVDLDAFARNLARIREQVAPAEHLLVVKDDAYRHGLPQIVERAVAEGVRWIGAIDVTTAAAARAAAGGDVRILAWMPTGADDVREGLDADLDLGAGTAEILEDIAAVAAERGVTARAHLKIDTGLHRNGVRPEHWGAFVHRAVELEAAGAVSVVGIWTHIAEASDAEDDAQRAVFDAAVAQARGAGLSPEILHVAASAAAFARPEYRYDLVRIGAFAYGIRSADGPSDAELGITPIGALRGAVTKLTRVGALVDVGAAHGLLSTAGGALTAAGPTGRIPVIQVRQDATVVEAWPGAAVGDEVTLFGANDADSATDLAERLDTIGEEIVLRLSPELPRTYS